MNRHIAFLLVAPVLLLGALGCTGPLFGINLTVVGERTALERQVLGTYAEIGRDLGTYASVRGVDPGGSLKPAPELTDSQAAVLRAMNNRRYNRDDLDRLLLAGVVGEGNDGRLVRLEDRPLNVVEEIPEDLARLVIQEENADRETILQRLMTTTPGVNPEDSPEVAWIFSTLNHDLAPATSYIQERDGRWRRK